MTEEGVLKSLIPIAILSKLIFGDEEDKFFNELHELGILHFRDNTPINPSPTTLNSSKGRQLTRAISINANGKVEVERQFSNGIEKFTVSAKTKDPIKLESLDKEIFVLKEKDIKLDFQLRNVQLYDINNYVIKGIKSMGHDEWARIHFDLPEIMKLTCRYLIFGMMAGRNVNEGGTAVMRLRGVKVEGRVKVDVTDESMRIDDMDLQYSFQDLSIEKIGLIIAGMSKDQINQLFNDAGKKYLQENLPLVAERLSAEIKTKLNERLKDLTGAKLIRTVRQKDFQEDEILDSANS